MNRTVWIVLGVVAAVVLGIGAFTASSYNRLVSLEQGVDAQWAQVENVYQRRADLVPNLVETVKGAANFEQQTLEEVTEARAKVGSVNLPAPPSDAASFQRFQQSQDQLTSALSHLIAVSEAYPDLKATQNFRDLQAQLEGTENRITVERQRFNDAAREFNTARDSFPTVMIAGSFGSKFDEKPYFQAQSGAEQAPKVKF